MIDDATIKRVAQECGAILGMKLDGIQYVVPKTASFTVDQLSDFARAIEQLARREQREEDARICDELSLAGGCGKATTPGGACLECGEAIRAAGKENSNE